MTSQGSSATPGNDDTGKINTGRKPVTEARKQQNRVAQKTYRERKKRRLQTLERLVNSNGHLWEARAHASGSGHQDSSEDQPGLSLESEGQVNLVDTSFNPDYTSSLIGTSFASPATNIGFHDLPLIEDQNITQPFPSNSLPLSDFATDWGGLTFGNFATMPINFIPSPEDSLDLAADFGQKSTSLPEGFSASSAPSLPTLDEENIDAQPSGTRIMCIYRPTGPRTAVLPSTFRRYFLELPTSEQKRLIQMASAKDYRFVDIICGGLTESALEPMVLPQIQYGLSALANAEHFDPYSNNLAISRISYFTAIFMNASALGFDFAEYLNENSTSPLYDSSSNSPGSQDTPESSTTTTTKYSNITKDLRPVKEQITKKHHPYLDVLPFPMFRQRAITAASTNPPLLDEDDLCIDLMIHEGLVCWGSPGGDAGMDMGAPWDQRSWEAKPWFLEKWWWLVGDRDEEMWSGARWWQMMRRVR